MDCFEDCDEEDFSFFARTRKEAALILVEGPWSPCRGRQLSIMQLM